MREEDKPVPRFECSTCGHYWPNEEEKRPEIMKDYVPRAKFTHQGSAPTYNVLPEGKRGPKRPPLQCDYFHVACMDEGFEKGKMLNISHCSSPQQKRFQIERQQKLQNLAKEKGIIKGA